MRQFHLLPQRNLIYMLQPLEYFHTIRTMTGAALLVNANANGKLAVKPIGDWKCVR